MGQKFTCHIGGGGAGGAACESNEAYNQGTLGEDSAFGAITSEKGVSYRSGYKNLLTGELLALTGDFGISGGNGGGSTREEDNINPGNPVVIDGVSYTVGGDGEDVSHIRTSAIGTLEGTAGKGYGGGAAAGGNGLPGGKGKLVHSTTSMLVNGAIGGNGAAATLPAFPQSKPGGGGNGGHGGGGGGANDITVAQYTRRKDSSAPMASYDATPGVAGIGGNGGPGGVGGRGFILVYW